MHDDQKLDVKDIQALWEEKDLATFEGAFRTKTGETIEVHARSPNELIEALTNLNKVPVGAGSYRGIGPGDT